MDRRVRPEPPGAFSSWRSQPTGFPRLAWSRRRRRGRAPERNPARRARRRAKRPRAPRGGEVLARANQVRPRSSSAQLRAHFEVAAQGFLRDGRFKREPSPRRPRRRSRSLELERAVELVLARPDVVLPAVPGPRGRSLELPVAERPPSVQAVALRCIERALDFEERELALARRNDACGARRRSSTRAPVWSWPTASRANLPSPFRERFRGGTCRRGHDPAVGVTVLPREARRAPRREPPADDDGQHRPADLVSSTVARVDPDEVAEVLPGRFDPRFHESHRHGRAPRGAGGGPRPIVVQVGVAERASRLWTSSSRRLWGTRDVHHRGALYRHQRLVLRGRLSGRCIHVADRMLVIDPEECTTRRLRAGVPGRGDFSGGRAARKWEPGVKINYAYGYGMDVVNQLARHTRRSTTCKSAPGER